MFKFLIQCILLFCTLQSSLGFAMCHQSVEVGVGWRRDNLKWRVKGLGLDESCVDAKVFSHILFKEIDMYMISGKARWIDCGYYIRLAADYGRSEKGRAHEHFKIESPLLLAARSGELSTHESNRIKRRSEAYNFNGAVGYPFTFYCCRLNVVPLIGYSYHRQRLRVKRHSEGCYSSFCKNFSLSSVNPFLIPSSDPLGDSSDSSCCNSSYSCFNPFSSGSCSSESIASLLGFSAKRRTSVYRFTWFGPFLGVDLAYALDPCWTLFTELEYHLLDRCNRKRKSNTAVDFVDDYHAKGKAYGFNGTFGTTFYIANCWYSTIAVEYKCWRSTSHKKGHRCHCSCSDSSDYCSISDSHFVFKRYKFSCSEDREHTRKDKLKWNSAQAYITLGYMF